jgi:hypothetical protein
MNDDGALGTRAGTRKAQSNTPRRGPSGGVTATTFDPLNTGATFTLSNGNLTATCNSTTANGDFARVNNGHSTGKFYYEVTVTTIASPQSYDSSWGVISSTCPVHNSNAGSANCAVQFIQGDGNIYINGSSNANGQTTPINQGDVVQCAVDIGGSLIWLAINGGNWNRNGSANPATGVGGLSISTVTANNPLYAAVGSGTLNNALTANFGATSYSFTPPSGFGNW